MKNGIFAATAASIISSLWNVTYYKASALSTNHHFHSSDATIRNLPVSKVGLDSNGDSNDNVGNVKNAGDNGIDSRRKALSRFSIFTTAAAASSLLTSTTIPQPAWGAPILTPEDADSYGAQLERYRREKPPKVLRPMMNQDFAVLLMRSSYNAMDQIDCVAMDQFQKDFFFIRSAEYLPYVNSLGPGLVQQGNLTNPYYFDFISFAQYATIYYEIKCEPRLVFEEEQGVFVGDDLPQKFVTTVVRRDPSLKDNSLLPKKHNELVGIAILDKLDELFGKTTSAIPKLGTRPDPDMVLRALRQLTNLFLINGFAFGGRASLLKEGNGRMAESPSSGAEFEIRFNAPATLWSGKALQLRKANPGNDFILKCARVMLSRSGYSIKSSSVKYSINEEITAFTIK